jgi:hypothetical protein
MEFFGFVWPLYIFLRKTSASDGVRLMEFMEVTPETLDQRCRYPESNDLGEILYGVDDVCHSVNEASLANVFITCHNYGKSQFLMGKSVNQL